MQKKHKHKELNSTSLLWVLDDVLPPQECAALIERAEAEGFKRTGEGLPGRKQRHNARVVIFDEALAQRIFDAVEAVLPPRLIGMKPLHANECLRFYKYVPGDFFKPHQDTDFFVHKDLRSLLSVVTYLNDEAEGGELFIPATEQVFVPKPGRTAIFGHRLVHESKPILSGIKYAFRTDIMYSRR